MIRYLFSILLFVLSSFCEAAVTKLTTEEITALLEEAYAATSTPKILRMAYRVLNINYETDSSFHLGDPAHLALGHFDGQIFNLRGFSPSVVCKVNYNETLEYWVLSFHENKVHSIQIFKDGETPKTGNFTREDTLFRANYFLPKNSQIDKHANWEISKDGKVEKAQINHLTIVREIKDDIPYILLFPSENKLKKPAIPFLPPSMLILKEDVLFNKGKISQAESNTKRKLRDLNFFYYKTLTKNEISKNKFFLGDTLENVLKNIEGRVCARYSKFGSPIFCDFKKKII